MTLEVQKRLSKVEGSAFKNKLSFEAIQKEGLTASRSKVNRKIAKEMLSPSPNWSKMEGYLLQLMKLAVSYPAMRSSLDSSINYQLGDSSSRTSAEKERIEANRKSDSWYETWEKTNEEWYDQDMGHQRIKPDPWEDDAY